MENAKNTLRIVKEITAKEKIEQELIEYNNTDNLMIDIIMCFVDEFHEKLDSILIKDDIYYVG